jgi:predicted amidohydrolase
MKVRVASAQYPIEWLDSFAAWRDKQARWVAEAKQHGAQLLVLPEYAAMELTCLLPPSDQSTLARQLAAAQALWPKARATHALLAAQHGVWLLGGSMPERVGTEYRNCARLYGPSGESHVQEKLQMTRFEREDWHVSPGSEQTLIDTPFGTLGIATCYDSEFPLITRRLAEAGASIVLVPSCTDTLAGYHRVSLSCRARALENQCYVVHAVTVGIAPWSLALDDNHGAAAIHTPVDRGFPDDGVLAQGQLDQPGWVYGTLDLDLLREVRASGQVKNFDDWSRPGHLAAGLTRKDDD